jgi:hypothetical protein
MFMVESKNVSCFLGYMPSSFIFMFLVVFSLTISFSFDALLSGLVCNYL